MSDRPKNRWIRCPTCQGENVAVLPPKSEIVDDEEDADGKVRVDCWDCDERFLVYYRTRSDGE